jgi:hypothetical protein
MFSASVACRIQVVMKTWLGQRRRERSRIEQIARDRIHACDLARPAREPGDLPPLRHEPPRQIVADDAAHARDQG